jgi:hypothetical protein
MPLLPLRGSSVSGMYVCRKKEKLFTGENKNTCKSTRTNTVTQTTKWFPLSFNIELKVYSETCLTVSSFPHKAVRREVAFCTLRHCQISPDDFKL